MYFYKKLVFSFLYITILQINSLKNKKARQSYVGKNFGGWRDNFSKQNQLKINLIS